MSGKCGVDVETETRCYVLCVHKISVTATSKLLMNYGLLGMRSGGIKV
jgi:hypothetical protein